MYLKIFLIKIIVILPTCQTYKIINSTNYDVRKDLVFSFLTQFTDYNMMFHFENVTKSYIDIIFESKIENRNNSKIGNRTYFMINYDMNPEKSGILFRPEGYKYLHVVYLAKYQSFDRYTFASEFNLEFQDIVLFIINFQKQDNFELWDRNLLNRSGEVFILNSKDLSLNTICFYCGNISSISRKIVGLTIKEQENKVELPNLKFYVNKFNNFNQHKFRVAYTEYRPYFWVTKTFINNTPGYEIHGSEGELLSVLSKKLNFGLQLQEFVDIPDIWKSMVDAVRDKKVDWAVAGITSSMERMKIADFTHFIRPEPYTALYCIYEDIWMSWENILMPFQLTVWIVLAFATTVIAFLLYLSIKFTHAEEKLGLLYYIQGCWRFLVEQALPDVPPVLTTRWTSMWLMGLWWMMALIITNSYKSKLTSSLINSKASEPDSIDALNQQGFYFQTNKEDSSILRENLKSSNDPVFMEVLKRAKNDLDFCPSVLKTLGNRIAVIDEETTLHYEVLTNCKKNMNLEDQQNLRLIRDELFPSTQAWPLQLAAPYRTQFSAVISRLHASGLFLKWHADAMEVPQLIPKSHSGVSSTSEVKFDLVTILGPALIWLTGIIISCLVLLVEILLGIRKRHKLKKKIAKQKIAVAFVGHLYKNKF